LVEGFFFLDCLKNICLIKAFLLSFWTIRNGFFEIESPWNYYLIDKRSTALIQSGPYQTITGQMPEQEM